MKKTRRAQFLAYFQCLLVVMMFAVSFSVQAEDVNADAPIAGGSGQDCSFEKFKNALGGRESGGNYGITNTYNYLGKYQFGEAALQTVGWYLGDKQQGIPGSKYYQDFSGGWSEKAKAAGVNSYQDFLNCMTCQEQAMDALVAANQATIRNGPLAKYIGQNVGGVTMTESGLIAACHLKGCGGTLACLQGGGCTDGYGTSAYEYAKKFGGYDMQNAAGDGTCKQYANTSSPRAATAGNPICQEKIYADVTKQVERMIGVQNQIAAKILQPPILPSTIANTPCMSQQMASITNQFSYAPTNVLGQVTGAATSNPVGSLVAGVFRSGYNSSMKEMTDFLGGFNLTKGFDKGMSMLMEGLGATNSPFAKDVCGLMLDTLLNYIQCETNFGLPSMGSLPSININIPGGCAAQVARNTAYQAANKQSFDILNQKPQATLPKSVPTQGSGSTY